MDTKHSSLEGKLSKYTNVVKGWQNRYFVTNSQLGMLEYHILQPEVASSNGKPRGALSLSGAVIAPSIDDDLTFSVNATNGEIYKLRANSTKERQKWISHLRSVAHHCTSQIAQEHPPLTSQRKLRTASFKSQLSNNLNKIKDPATEILFNGAEGYEVARQISKNETGHQSNQVQQLSTAGNSNSSLNKPLLTQEILVTESVSAPGGIQNLIKRGRNDSQSSLNKLTRTVDAGKTLPKSTLDELTNAREVLISAANYHAGLMNQLENLYKASADTHAPSSLALDRNVLLIKAVSTAMLQSLSTSYIILNKYHIRTTPAFPRNAAITWVEPRRTSTSPAFVAEVADSMISIASFESPSLADPNDEVKDPILEQEEDLGPVDEHKNVIMHLLSQLKLGMDLTKVTLPTFILEKRSLLEMYADFLGHTELFLAISNGPTPERRICRVLKFFLSSFHCGRRSQTAKKPYNPIVGEVFQCSYYVPKNNKGMSNEQSETRPPSTNTHYRLKFLAEQVSHHPPVSAFFVNCPEKKIQLSSHIWTKSRFMNMTVGVNIVGEGTLSLLSLDEQYVMTYPSAYARSILTVPWSELGGRCSITCEKTGMLASVNFHTKPTYGGQPHRVTAEVKDSDGFVFCRADGKWNGDVEFSYYTKSKEANEAKPRTEMVKFSKIPVYSKYVVPIYKQCQMESRKLWHKVTEALRNGDVVTATQYKKYLEDQQREVEAKRLEDGRELTNAYFDHTKGSDFDRYFVKENMKALTQM